MRNFPEISKIMKARQGGIECNNTAQLRQAIEELLKDRMKREAIGHAGRTIIEENQGALEQTLTLIDRLLSPLPTG